MEEGRGHQVTPRDPLTCQSQRPRSSGRSAATASTSQPVLCGRCKPPGPRQNQARRRQRHGGAYRKIADRTRARHAEVHRMMAGGSIGEIAATLSLSPNTVRRFACATSPEEHLVNDGTGTRDSILDEHASYLGERWTTLASSGRNSATAATRAAPLTSDRTSPATAEPPLLLLQPRPAEGPGRGRLDDDQA
jgi:hypothetical protein